MEKTLVRAEKKLSWLQNNLQELEFAKVALEQQDQAINLLQERLRTGGTADQGDRKIGGILAGVVDDEIIFGKLKGLKIQADHFQKLLKNSRRYKKSEYEAFEKITIIQVSVFTPEEENEIADNIS